MKYVDVRELLVIYHTLTSQIKINDDEQRENIFHMRCTIKNKVCGVIIDRGSCTNVAFTTLVEKLNFPTIKHPYPYWLQLLNDNRDVKLTNQVLMLFTIGKSHKDEVLCGVVAINVSYLLLGRLWQYDKKTTYDGFWNTYSFTKYGKKHRSSAH